MLVRFDSWPRHVNIDFCYFDKVDREAVAPFGMKPPHRVHINTKRWHFAFAYLPGSRFAGRPGVRSRWTSFRVW